MRLWEYEETFDVEGRPANELHRLGEEVMGHLLELEGGRDDLTDAAVSTDAGEMTITVELAMVVQEDTRQEQAEVAIRSAVRTAFHAAGGATPGWHYTKREEGSRLELASA